MTAKELKRIFSKGECLSLDTLRLYNDGKLNKKSMHEIEKHLLECNLCSGAVDGLNTKRIAEVNKLSAHIQRRLAVYINTPPRVSFFQRFGLVIIIGAVFLAVGGTWLYYSLNHKKEAPQISDTTQSIKKENQNTFSHPTTSSIEKFSANQETQNPVIITQQEIKNPDNSSGSSGKMQNLPADRPGEANTFTVKQESPSSSTNTTTSNENGSGPSTRTSNAPQLLRIKSVQVYPAITHNDKQVRKEAKEGQLGRPSGSTASFEIDEMPTFPGGTEALRNYIINNFKSAPTDKSKLTRFATGILFVVNSKTGAISSPELSFGISPEIDKELLRVITTMPKWTPGKKRGEVDIMIGITLE